MGITIGTDPYAHNKKKTLLDLFNEKHPGNDDISSSLIDETVLKREKGKTFLCDRQSKGWRRL